VARFQKQDSCVLPHHKHFYTSSVMEYIVPDVKAVAFEDWYKRLRRVARYHSGFLRADLCTPLNCEDGVIKYYSIIHFASPSQLELWLSSEARNQFFKEGESLFLAYRFKSFTTGLEGWFSLHGGSRGSLGPPRWKQLLSVVLGLYPTVMIQGMVFGALGVMQGWPLPTTMLVNNLITSALLTWVVMPRVSKFLKFWLRPAYSLTPRQVDLAGAAVVLSLLGTCVVLFNWLQKLNL
jgi:antibiotic biosynthesis monooxygenase (ABM) superfamily enzyme